MFIDFVIWFFHHEVPKNTKASLWSQRIIFVTLEPLWVFVKDKTL